MLMLVALSSISWLIEGNIMKGVAVTCIGILISTIGISTNTAAARYTFGSIQLLSGVNFIPLVVGFIGMAQVFNLVSQKKRENELVIKKLTLADCKLEREDLSRMKGPVARGGLLGSIIGFIPGAGAPWPPLSAIPYRRNQEKTRNPWAQGPSKGLRPLKAQTMAQPQAHSAPFLPWASREAEQRRFSLEAHDVGP